MGQALYRTYRSKKLSEIVGQEHITQALDHALAKGTLSHAYLFTGPRGVGKTSIARILAHEINQLPYNEDRQHLDIIEIDAASNRRIDEIRDLRDKVHIAPTSAKFKVYIIDEVHMLTKEAFNALLKTLEEPPAHVVFILATTEVHKLPETIISRTQRFAFKPVDLPKVIEHLKFIAKKEGIVISDDALQLVAAHGEGSFRDSISLLDQVRNTSGDVDLSAVQGVLGIAPEELIEATLQAVESHDVVAASQQLQALYNQGFEPAQIARQLSHVIREHIIHGTATLPHELSIPLLEKLLQVPASPDPKISLQITLLDVALAGTPSPIAIAKPAAAKPAPAQRPAAPVASAQKVMPAQEVKAAPAVKITPTHPLAKPKEDEKATVEATKSEPEIVEASQPETPVVVASTGDMMGEREWQDVLAAIKSKYNTLYSVARTARAHFAPGTLTLEFTHAFHQKRLNESRNKEIICEMVLKYGGHEVQLNCIKGQGKTEDELRPVAAPPLPDVDGEIVHSVANKVEIAEVEPQEEAMETISNIFGGAEVLEP
jgi:DNA polymerase-3 subunit gamma/tau